MSDWFFENKVNHNVTDLQQAIGMILVSKNDPTIAFYGKIIFDKYSVVNLLSITGNKGYYFDELVFDILLFLKLKMNRKRDIFKKVLSFGEIYLNHVDGEIRLLENRKIWDETPPFRDYFPPNGKFMGEYLNYMFVMTQNDTILINQKFDSHFYQRDGDKTNFNYNKLVIRNFEKTLQIEV